MAVVRMHDAWWRMAQTWHSALLSRLLDLCLLFCRVNSRHTYTHNAKSCPYYRAWAECSDVFGAAANFYGKRKIETTNACKVSIVVVTFLWFPLFGCFVWHVQIMLDFYYVFNFYILHTHTHTHIHTHLHNFNALI